MIEIKSSNPETIEILKQIAKSDTKNILDLPQSGANGVEILTLIVENWTSLAFGTVGLIAALKMKIGYLEITKDGLILKESEKQELLDNVK